MILTHESGSQEDQFDEKKWRQKISWDYPLSIWKVYLQNSHSQNFAHKKRDKLEVVSQILDPKSSTHYGTVSDNKIDLWNWTAALREYYTTVVLHVGAFFVLVGGTTGKCSWSHICIVSDARAGSCLGPRPSSVEKDVYVSEGGKCRVNALLQIRLRLTTPRGILSGGSAGAEEVRQDCFSSFRTYCCRIQTPTEWGYIYIFVKHCDVLCAMTSLPLPCLLLFCTSLTSTNSITSDYTCIYSCDCIYFLSKIWTVCIGALSTAIKIFPTSQNMSAFCARPMPVSSAFLINPVAREHVSCILLTRFVSNLWKPKCGGRAISPWGALKEVTKAVDLEGSIPYSCLRRPGHVTQVGCLVV
jgi:hypothetical protein